MTTDVSWNRLRKQVKIRHGSICYHCGNYADKGHCDHLIPLSKGGTDAIDNLVWSCGQCNLKKGNKMPDKLPKQFIPKFELPKAEPINPHFDRILPDLFTSIIAFFISPYPEWNQARFMNYIHYYEIVMGIRRRFPISTWLRERIWPISYNLGIVLYSIDTLDDLEKRMKYKPKNYSFRFDICPKCNAPAVAEFESDYRVIFNWTCSSGHSGQGIDEFSDWYIYRMETASIEWAWGHTEPKPPDPWERDSIDSPEQPNNIQGIEDSHYIDISQLQTWANHL